MKPAIIEYYGLDGGFYIYSYSITILMYDWGFSFIFIKGMVATVILIGCIKLVLSTLW